VIIGLNKTVMFRNQIISKIVSIFTPPHLGGGREGLHMS